MAAQDENRKNINEVNIVESNTADKNTAGNKTAVAAGSAAEIKDPESSIIELTDEKGEKVRFELLDIVDYSARTYAVAVPADTDSDEVTVFRIENDPENENIQTLTPETRTSTAQAVFGLFRDRNADRFDFN